MRGLALLIVAWTAVAGAVRAEASSDDDCWARRQHMLDAAEHEPRVSERIALLDALPDCQPREAPSVPDAPHARRGFLLEVAGGAGTSIASMNGTSSTAGMNVAVSAGLGGFVTPEVALIVRTAGVASSGNGGYAGFLRPTLQIWPTHQLFVGGGVGLGVTTCSWCRQSVGFDARAGYAFARDGHGGNVSLEATHHTVDVDRNSLGITTLLVLLGYAGF